ncbi:hypothetical protein C8R43DRAFT_1063213 [Mycena crocata]|nr:hypothetical protein C8R43DRAFT_1063213 [Mycena crocata]
MPTERKRFVYKEWVRDPKGKLLVKPPPKGKRTPNNIIWGHTLDDFFWIPRIPTVNVLTIWSRSMIQEYGENYLNESHDDEPEPRRLRPWPVLMLPAHIRTPISSELGIIDRDCADRHDPVPRRVEEVVGGKPNVATGTKAKPKGEHTLRHCRLVSASRVPRYQLRTPHRLPVRFALPFATSCHRNPSAAACSPRWSSDNKEWADAKNALPVDKADPEPLATEKEGVAATETEGVSGTEIELLVATETDAPKNGDGAVADKPARADERSDGMLSGPPTFHDLPKLEEFIPDEYFPDILFVNDPDDNTTITASYNYKYRDSKPQSEAPLLRQYKRVWPPPSISASHSSPPTVPSPGTNFHVARLNLSSAPRLGIGNHSVVHRAALRLPHPLAGRSPSGEVTVAAKTSFSNSEARALLLNEGRIYDAFPKHLQEDWCGLNLVAPITHPVPVHAVVPKFYGYYAPVREDVERDRQAAFKYSTSYQSWSRMSPILLLEECGSPIVPSKFSDDDRSECYSLALRLHFSEFTQGSFYVRNILRQPGPLTVAPSERSNRTPSFRIIDFGRGEHWPYQLAAAEKENEERRAHQAGERDVMDVPTEAEMKQRIEEEEEEDAEDKKVLERCGKSWWESRDYEVRKAHSELIVKDFDY